MLQKGLTHTSVMTVEELHSAANVGSGDMPVLATPMMMALMENAAMLAVDQELPQNETTVGGYIESSHLRPTPIGAEIYATATLENIDGKKLEFHVIAKQDDVTLGEGRHVRYIVDREKFMNRIKKD